ncbi:dihydropteroate synthase [Algoriphagus lacus]|uniref:dihydropteroate synthase n=1 Tax=Algoriphagus lacus TaxID=2056311 RepID=A0A418PV37_9BACT|nr:dihydropteroate synthase [Algoriphagus lacus]RIW17369.1 dihydropteroate synthase [Algoriphagus lacus]
MLSGSSPSSSIEDKLFPQKYTLQIKGRLISLDKPKVMGILNLTPDSFFEGSRVAKSPDSILFIAEKMIREGADFLDLGGYSTRPGAVDISVEEELQRVVPAVEVIRREFPEILISIDTFRSKVALESVTAGADLVNDISAGNLGKAMLPLVAKLGVPYIAMHMKGNPQNMQSQANYSDILTETLYYFAEKVDLIKKLGIKDVIIDPGFGFAKTIEQNFFLLRNLKSFEVMGFPLLAGVSRKSMIYKTLQIEPKDALNGTTALNMFALLQGANILRVHDVKEAKETIKLYEKIYP